MCLFGVEANFQQRLVPRRVQKTPNAAVSPDWPQILSSAVNNYSLWRKTNSAACHLSLGLKPPAGSSRGAPALLFLFVVVMVGVCPCQSPPSCNFPLPPHLTRPSPTATHALPRFWPPIPGSALLPPGGEEREFSSALPRLIILSANRRRDFLSLGVNRPLMMLIMEIKPFFLLVLLTGCKVTAGPEPLSLASFLFCIRRLRRVKSSRVC